MPNYLQLVGQQLRNINTRLLAYSSHEAFEISEVKALVAQEVLYVREYIIHCIIDR